MISAFDTARPESVAYPGQAGLAELAMFLLIGGGAALAFVGASSTAVRLITTVPDWIVSSLTYLAMIGPVYLLHRRFSFQSGARHRIALPRYILVQISGLALASLFSYVAYGVIGLPALAASTLVIVLTSGINFAVLKLWAFAGMR